MVTSPIPDRIPHHNHDRVTHEIVPQVSEHESFESLRTTDNGSDFENLFQAFQVHPIGAAHSSCHQWGRHLAEA
jgi:hypothetical protein